MNNFFQRIRTAFRIFVLFLLLLMLPPIFLSTFFLMLLLFVLYAEWPIICSKYPLFYFLTPLYPIMPFILLLVFSLKEEGKAIIAFLFLFTAIFDTGCYIVGNFCGNTPLLPSISPKKTLEGFVGGICTVLIMGFIFANFLSIFNNYLFFMFLIGMSFFAAAGDFFESWIKRQAGVKDSGTLLPGHGGILDRIDSLLFVVIYFYCIKIFF